MNEDFDWNAFIDDTNELSLAAVGGWLKCLHKMRKSVTRGRISMPIEGYARMFGSSVDQAKRVVDELLDFGTASSEVSESSQNITLINRRMYREFQAVEANRIRQLRFQRETPELKTNGTENNGKITTQRVSLKEDKEEVDTRRKKTKKDVERVFEFWQRTLDHPKAILTKERKNLIAARLEEGYGIADLEQAILGCKASPYHNGKNDTGAIYHGIDLIFRNGSHVERFIGYLSARPPSSPSDIGKYVPSAEPVVIPGCAYCDEPYCLRDHAEERQAA